MTLLDCKALKVKHARYSYIRKSRQIPDSTPATYKVRGFNGIPAGK